MASTPVSGATHSAPDSTASLSATESRDGSEFSDIDIRVGQIVRAWPHPDSEKLWCEEIDVGEEGGPRQIASGLRAHYAHEDDMVGRKVLVVCNLKPAKLAGFPSNGMVLCASKMADAETPVVEFVEPPVGAPVGERVRAAGVAEAAPAGANRVKRKKLFERMAEGLATTEGGVATWWGARLEVDAGHCAAHSIGAGAQIL